MQSCREKGSHGQAAARNCYERDSMSKSADVAERLIGQPYAQMDEPTRKVAHHLKERKHIARHPDAADDIPPTRGQRAADAVASFGGSWTFIGIFGAVMLFWVLLNSFLLLRIDKSFDPYPYILLNLFLSMLASIQAPIILMSQNRHAEKDRQDAEHDYEVNLKAELEIMLLHEKMDLLRESQWNDLLAIQKQQMALLSSLIDKKIAS
jgi:uncharacterized membrane protein